MFDNGLHDGWQTPSIPKLESEDDEITLTSLQSAWVINFVFVGTAIGPFLAMFLMEKIGRKWTLLLAALPKICSWLLIAFAGNYIELYIARFFAGIGAGITLTVTPIYVGEVMDKRIRGPLGSLIAVMINIGTLVVYSIGVAVTRIVLALVCVWVPVIFLVTFIWMPESPYSLAKRGRITDAELALKWSRGKDDIDEELQTVLRYVSREEGEQKMTMKDTLKEMWTRRGNRKAIRIVLVLFSAMLTSGNIPVLSYQSYIFEEADFHVDSDTSVILTGCSLVFTGLVCVSVVKYTGKRLILLISAPATAFCLSVIATFFTLKSVGIDVSAFSWVPMVFVILFVVSYGFGLDVMAYAYQGEVLPDNIKSITAMLCSVWYSGWAMVTVQVYQILDNNYGTHVPLWVFFCSTLIMWFIIYAIIPETEGKSLEEILRELHEEKTTQNIMKRSASVLFG